MDQLEPVLDVWVVENFDPLASSLVFYFSISHILMIYFSSASYSSMSLKNECYNMAETVGRFSAPTLKIILMSSIYYFSE